jgi:hypothetical protein
VTDERYESELTEAAGNSVEQGVNEAGAPTTRGDEDFKIKKSQAKVAAKKKTKKKRKAQKAARKRH